MINFVLSDVFWACLTVMYVLCTPVQCRALECGDNLADSHVRAVKFNLARVQRYVCVYRHMCS